MDVDISKPLKMELSIEEMVCSVIAFWDYENITDICYGCGSQDHKFDTCNLNSKNISFKIKNV